MASYPTLTISGAALLAMMALAGCSDKTAESTQAATQAAQQAAEKVTGKKKVKLKGDTPLDAAAYSVTSVMSSKFKDYHITGNTVRLVVKDGVAMSGSECTIINAATKADHPHAAFVIDSGSATVTC